MKVSKDLGFPNVPLAGVEHMPAKGKDEQEAARVFYTATTGSTQMLMIGVGEDSGFESSMALQTVNDRYTYLNRA